MSNKVDGFMTNALWSRRMVALVASLEVCILLGCGSRPYQVAEVDGVVLINGKPAGNLFVQFIPEVSGEASPPPSNGKTDESGHFVLNLIEPGGTMQAGAAVGSHRVVLRDLQAASSSANGTLIRLPVQYTMPGATPLIHEVKEGQQTIEINVPAK